MASDRTSTISVVHSGATSPPSALSDNYVSSRDAAVPVKANNTSAVHGPKSNEVSLPINSNTEFATPVLKTRNHYIPKLSKLSILVSSSTMVESLRSSVAFINPSFLSALILGLGVLVVLFRCRTHRGYHRGYFHESWVKHSIGGESEMVQTTIRAHKKKKKATGRRKAGSQQIGNKNIHLTERHDAPSRNTSVSPASRATETSEDEARSREPFSETTINSQYIKSGSICTNPPAVSKRQHDIPLHTSEEFVTASGRNQQVPSSFSTPTPFATLAEVLNDGDGEWQVVPSRLGKAERRTSHSLNQSETVHLEATSSEVKQTRKNSILSNQQTFRRKSSGRYRNPNPERPYHNQHDGKKLIPQDTDNAYTQRKTADCNSHHQHISQKQQYHRDRQQNTSKKNRQYNSSKQSHGMQSNCGGSGWGQKPCEKQVAPTFTSINRWNQNLTTITSKDLDSSEFPSMMDHNQLEGAAIVPNVLVDESYCVGSNSNGSNHNLDENPVTPMCPQVNEESKYDSIDINGIDEIQSCPSCPERGASPNILETPQVDDLNDEDDVNKYKDLIIANLQLPATVNNNSMREKSTERSIVSSICRSVLSEENIPSSTTSALPSSLGEGDISAVSVGCTTGRWCDLVDSDFSDDEDTTRDDDDSNTIMGDDVSFDRHSRHSQNNQFSRRQYICSLPEDQLRKRSVSEFISLGSIDNNWRSNAWRGLKPRLGSESCSQSTSKGRGRGLSNPKNSQSHYYWFNVNNQRCLSDRRGTCWNQNENETDGRSPMSSRNEVKGKYPNQERNHSDSISVDQSLCNSSTSCARAKYLQPSEKHNGCYDNATTEIQHRNGGDLSLNTQSRNYNNQNQLITDRSFVNEQDCSNSLDKKSCVSSTLSKSESAQFHLRATLSLEKHTDGLVTSVSTHYQNRGNECANSSFEQSSGDRNLTISPVVPSGSRRHETNKNFHMESAAYSNDRNNGWREVESSHKIKTARQIENSPI